MEEKEESKEERKNEKSEKKRKMVRERESRDEIQTDREKVNDLIFLLLSYKQEIIR